MKRSRKRNGSFTTSSLRSTKTSTSISMAAYPMTVISPGSAKPNRFHWVAEFYEIMHNGGFDVIIGNPPYLEKRQISYEVIGYATGDTSAVHAYCIERSTQIVNSDGHISMIVPISIVCTQRMVSVQKIIEGK